MMTEKKDKVNIDSYDMSYVDYILSGLATQFSGLLSSSGNIESWFFATKLKQIEIQKPVFITGLARAGTTILLQTLSNVEGVATHRYRDFPFIMTPIIWNRFVSLFSKQQVPIQRPHKDRIEITRESPDAFEEPIWQFFFPFVHNTDSSHVLDESLSNPQFEKFFTDHLKKIVMIRKGTRYVSKGNYNLTRIPYISKLFSDSKFVIPIRHPLAHVDSLVRQHKLFNDYSGQNKNIPEYLKSVGHYEFGPQRRPIHVSAEGARRIADAWSHGEDARGYAIQWAELYGFLYQLQRSVTCLADRILTIRYEDFCGEPELVITRILTFCEFDTQLPEGVDVAAIKPPSRKIALSEIDMNRCWDEVESVAHLYGYRRSCFTNTINN